MSSSTRRRLPACTSRYIDRVKYSGRAQLGDGDRATELVVEITDVEHPEWVGVIVEGAAPGPRRGELAVTLLDFGLYNAWRGSATLTTDASDGRTRLLGHDPFTPPVGA